MKIIGKIILVISIISIAYLLIQWIDIENLKYTSISEYTMEDIANISIIFVVSYFTIKVIGSIIGSIWSEND